MTFDLSDSFPGNSLPAAPALPLPALRQEDRARAELAEAQYRQFAAVNTFPSTVCGGGLLDGSSWIGTLKPMTGWLTDHDVDRVARRVLELQGVEPKLPAPKQESGWLVETPRPFHAGPTYWTGRGWSTDSLKALRFARADDARNMAEILGPNCVANEHVWVSP